jgi:hypothetical protein
LWVAFLLAAPVHAQQFTEVQVSTTAFADIEFDSARDGTYCPTCNFGQGNSRFNWTDNKGNLWLGHVNGNTGAFEPQTGKNELVDSSAAFWNDFGNGAEGASSQHRSQLVYTRYIPGMPRTRANAGAAMATMVDGIWTAGFLPGGLGSALPMPSQWLPDPIALVLYGTLAKPQEMLWHPVSLTAASPNPGPAGCVSVGARWAPGPHQFVCVGFARAHVGPNTPSQIFWYDADSSKAEQLTSGPTSKTDAFMFQAPELNNAWVFYTVSNDHEIDVYKQVGFNNAGAPTFHLIKQITATDPSEPYICSPEPVINCSPTCQSYIFMLLSSAPKLQNGGDPNGLAVANIDPADPLFTQLTDASSPVRTRADPEYFITANGPYLYYARSVPATATTPTQAEGEFYIDMQLGPPRVPAARRNKTAASFTVMR